MYVNVYLERARVPCREANVDQGYPAREDLAGVCLFQCYTLKEGRKEPRHEESTEEIKEGTEEGIKENTKEEIEEGTWSWCHGARVAAPDLVCSPPRNGRRGRARGTHRKRHSGISIWEVGSWPGDECQNVVNRS